MVFLRPRRAILAHNDRTPLAVSIPGELFGRFLVAACPGSSRAEIFLMGKERGDFTDILLQRQTLSPDQLEEAKSLQSATGAKPKETLVKLGYAATDEVMSAIAEFHGIQFINLAKATIPQSVVNLCPESA